MCSWPTIQDSYQRNLLNIKKDHKLSNGFSVTSFNLNILQELMEVIIQKSLYIHFGLWIITVAVLRGQVLA